MMKKFMTTLTMLAICIAAFAQMAPGQLVTWSSHVEEAEGADVYKVVFTGKIAEGYHTYTLTDEFSATEVMDVETSGCELVGAPYEISTPTEETDEFGDLARHYYNEIVIAQDVKLTAGEGSYKGTIFTNSCTGGACKAEYYDFEVTIGQDNGAAAGSKPVDKGDVWGLIFQAIAWGFAMLGDLQCSSHHAYSLWYL